jgi:signal transduction histidine kinase
VRIGLRLQILLFVAGLLLLAFVPLLWAQSALARLSIDQVQRRAALELGRSVAEADLSGLNIKSKLGKRILADWVLQPHGREASQSGPDVWVQQLLQLSAAVSEGTIVEVDHERALGVMMSDARGTARVAVALDPSSAYLHVLTRSFALYMGLVALMLLLAIFIALGRLVIQPLETLARAAQRVAAGSRRWEVVQMPARELGMLDSSLATMTAHLLNEEQELRRRIEDVNAATEKLKEAQQRLVRTERLASVGRLAAGLAHEIGNPIASLMGLQDLLIEGGLSATEQSDFLARMRRETERIHHILRDLLDFARPSQVQDREALREPGDVAGAIDDALALVSPQKVMKQVHVECKLNESLPLVALSRTELVQVLLNLLLNAADALSGEGAVTIRARRSGALVRIEIEDNGPGLAESVRERLFEPFVTTKEIGKGTGLGLAVCRGLVEGAGGLIGWDASFASGTRFVIELPLFVAADA